MNRLEFLKTMGVLSLSGSLMSLHSLKNMSQTFDRTDKLPVLFTSHGSSMDILSDTSLFRILKQRGEEIRRDYQFNAVLIVSAPWNTKGAFVNISRFPETIYDFTGFPEAFYALAQKLKSLRERGVLIVGSGSIVHNIPLAMQRFRSGNPSPYGWELEFDHWVMTKLEARDFDALVNYNAAKLSDLAVPTPDHYVPLIYSLGVIDRNEPIKSIHEGMSAAFSDRSFNVG